MKEKEDISKLLSLLTSKWTCSSVRAKGITHTHTLHQFKVLGYFANPQQAAPKQVSLSARLGEKGLVSLRGFTDDWL